MEFFGNANKERIVVSRQVHSLKLGRLFKVVAQPLAVTRARHSSRQRLNNEVHQLLAIRFPMPKTPAARDWKPWALQRVPVHRTAQRFCRFSTAHARTVCSFGTWMEGGDSGK